MAWRACRPPPWPCPVCRLLSLFSTRLSLFPGLCSLSFPLLFPLRCLQRLIFLQQLHQQSPIIFFLLIQDASASFYSIPLSFGFQSLPKLNLRSFFTEMKNKKQKKNRTRLHNLTIPSDWGIKIIRKDSRVLLPRNALDMPWWNKFLINQRLTNN